LTRYFEAMRAVVERHGGTVEKFIGDAILAAFGTPIVHEDDAIRAVRAAWEMRAALEDLNDRLEERWGVRLAVRTGVATGEVVAGGGTVLGSPANLAARLQGAAAEGEILVAHDTARLVRGQIRTEPAGSLELKGFDRAVETFRLVGLEATPRRRPDMPHVGRAHELALIDLAYRRAVDTRRCQLVTVLGEAGIGKTRLVETAVERLGTGNGEDDGAGTIARDPLVLRGRCLPYGEGITFFPVAEAVAAAAGIEPDDDAGQASAKVAALVGDDAAPIAARVSEAIGLGGAGADPEETLWAIRRYFELLAADRLLVLVFDDLQWAEPTFLDLVTAIVERGRDVAELVIAVARPELIEERPGWAGGTANAVTISLEPLTVPEGSSLVRHILREGQLDDDLTAGLVTAAGGNPLFLQEYVAMLLDDGVLEIEGDRWRAPAELSGAGATPPTLAGLLTARMHRLPTDERDALVHAAVIGKVFSPQELAAISPPAMVTDLDGILERLRDRGLVRTPQGAAPDARTLEFEHLLLRDAAYGSLPKARRAELHEAFADWLEAGAPDRQDEVAEITGYHLGTARDLRRELRIDDAATRALGDRAATWLGTAGGRAVERGDAPAAVKLLTRATDLATDRAARAGYRLRLTHALIDVGDAEAARSTIAAGRDDAASADDRRLVVRFEHAQVVDAFLSGRWDGTLEELDERFEQQASELLAFDDLEGVAECRYQSATIAWIRGDGRQFLDRARLALSDAESSGDRRRIGRALEYVLRALLKGPTPLPDALDELQKLRSSTSLGLPGQADVSLTEAEMLAYLGRHEEAHSLVEGATLALEELGQELSLAAAASVRGTIAGAAGSHREAEQHLRAAYDWFRAHGDLTNASVLAADLADVLARLQRNDAAEAMATTASRIADEDDLETQVGWRMALSRARAAQGDVDGALTIVEEAVDRLGSSDFMLLRGQALFAFGDVLAIARRPDQAARQLRAAADAYHAKGHVVGEREARAALERLGSARSSTGFRR
jgi:predicted negative regulator of RcsB-dependent stress response